MVPYGLDTPLILGVLEIGVFVTLVLFGVVFSQGYTYFSRNSANDGWRLRTFVGILIALEFAHTVASAHAIYYFTVVEAGISEELKKANTYSLSLTPVLETIITAMVQSFFAWRIRLLSSSGPRTLASWALPLVCWTLCLLRFVGGMAMGVEAFNDIPLEPDYFHYQDTYAWVIASALDIGVVLDVLITLSMCFYINRLNSPYNVEGSEVLIKRLINWAIQTGLITSLTSIAVVITFSTMKHNFIWLALYTLLAKLYSNSLLVSLNARPVNRQIVRGTGDSAAPLKTWSPNPTPRPSPPGSPRPSLDIRITQTRTIAMDPPVESSLPAYSQLASMSRASSPSPEMGLLTVPEKAAYVRSLV